jgi:dipeptidyl aminopeptidase/acylaminoacyl peptidase
MCWMPDGSAIIHVGADQSLWAQPVPSGVARRVATFDGPVEGPACTPDGRQVVVAVDRGSIWAVGTAGEGRPRRLDDGRHDFCIDPSVLTDGERVRVAWQAWSVPDMPWDRSVIASVPLVGGEVSLEQGVGQIQQFGAGPDGSTLCLRDDTGWLNLWLAGQPLVDESHEHGGPTWGPAQRSWALAPDESAVAFTRNEGGFGRLCVVDIRTRVVHEVARGVHGQLHWCGETLTALRSGARTPTQIVAYRTTGAPASWQRTVIAYGPPAGWENLDLVEPEQHEAVSTDRTVVPLRRYGAGNGRAIINIHGGPTDQWEVEFMPRIAYWCARGWDVIVPDPRGSTGHGRAYMQALRGGWGRDDVADIRTVARFIQERRWSTPSTTVVMGSSSGGMAALGVAIDGGDLIGGCIALYPVSEPADLAERSHRFEAHYALGLIGPEGDDAYRQRSMIERAASITVPVLLLHGSDDPVVPADQSRRLAAAITAAGGTVLHEEFAGEGHGFRQPENRRAEYRMVGEFLERVRSGHTVTGQ